MIKQEEYRAVIELDETMSCNVCSTNWGHIIVGAGATIVEAVEDFGEAVEALATSYESDGDTLEAQDLRLALRSVVYEYDVRSFLKYYKPLNVTQFALMLGISPELMRAYKSGAAMSEARAREIERGLRRIGQELNIISAKSR